MRGQGPVLRASFPGRGAALLGRPRGSAAARPTFRRPSLLPPPQGPAGDGDPSGARGGLPAGILVEAVVCRDEFSAAQTDL